MKKLLTKAAAYFSKMSRYQTWRVVVGCLACAVVFITTYALILPAITLENSKYEPDGHTHTEDCYQIVKTDAVTELDCPWINHTHTKECYDADGNLICDYRADYVVHIHDEYCYDADGNLVCSLPEIERHQHDDSCYNYEGSLICGMEEEEEHQHDDKCIKVIREASEEKILDCPYANSGPETEDEGDSGSADEQSEGTQEIAGSEESTNDEDENAENENANALENPIDSEDENTEDEEEDNGESSVIYSGENDSVSVEVILEEESTVPEDAVVRITKVTPENEDYDYALLKEQAENTVGEEAASQIDFYDISFYTAEGEYIPVTDTAKVMLRFKEEGNLAEAEEITVLHYKKDAEEPSCAENIEKESNDDQTWLSFQTAGFSVFGITPLSSGEEISPQTSGNEVTGLDGKTFAIVNEVNNAAYALTATNTTVNTVGGLAAQEVTVTEDEEKGPQIIGSAIPWTFHVQEDGSYYISTTMTGSDGTTVIKYLRLYETPYDSSNDGRGSLTLTEDANNASSIHVTDIGDGSVNLWMENSYINSDSETHNFWCFNNGTGDYSKHFLCEIMEPDYSGYWAIVNVKSNINTTSTSTINGVLMEAEGIGSSESANRKGTEVKVDVVKSAATVRSYNTDVTQWYFKKLEDGTYYISDTIVDENGESIIRYLNIGDSSSTPVILGATPMPITVTMGEGDNIGKVRLTNSAGMAVNLYGGNAAQGFGSYNDSEVNEWQTLCKVNRGIDVVKETANHPSSVINLFDYWITEQSSPDNVKGVPENLNLGINAGHDLKFVNENSLGEYNGWTGSAGCYTGIVENKLGTDGYPVLAVGSGKSLNYLFDPNTANDYRAVYQRTSGLLQTDSQGYYYYNSAQNFAELKSDSKNEFTLYDTWGVYSGGASGIKGQFFPFNKMENVMNATSTSEQMNHYFGLTLTTRFVQQYGGHTNSSRKTKTVFNFSGDDDVWIFIDNVLVADLGGIHNKASVSINFEDGYVTINDGNAATGSVKNLKALFNAAGQLGKESDWNGNTFADNSYHTLKFFYLERGNTDSNLYLQYNLTEIPTTGVYKVNQYGDVLGGAEFSVYKSDEDYNVPENATSVYNGITDDAGSMIFSDADGMPYTLNELKTLFGTHFVLRETKAPDNYSLVSEDIHLYIENGMLLCANTYDSGVYSSPTLLVTAPDILKDVNDTEKEYYNLNAGISHGTLFAVVLKYLGDGTSDFRQQKNWAPVYGNNEKGYTICTVNGDSAEDFVGAAIDAAKQQSSVQYGNSKVCFDVSANGMQLEIKNLPGDITTYYYVLGEDKSKTQYTVAYYYTTASDLSEATSQNTVRINADDTQHKFDRVFGATIEVPNLINRLFAQKVNDQDELINGATFALYQVEETESGIYYQTTDGSFISLEPDGDDDGKGTAAFQDGETEYRYEVCADGTIKILNADGNEIGYVIQPYKTAITLPFDSKENTAHEEGTASFVGLADGNYYLREVNVPKGYKLNGEEVMVKVAENAVYANAGVEDDGITVARGPGYLVYTLGRFASQGDVDNTLSWIYEQMRISGKSHTFTAYDEDQWKNWYYLKENVSSETVVEREDGCKIYLAYDPYAEGGDSGKAASDNAALFNYKVNEDKYRNELNYSEEKIKEVRRRLYTTVGWSYYEIYQDYDYGKEHSEGANYYKILDSGQPQEIANLFSRSTYVRVTDEKENGRLMIHKTVVNAPENNTDTYYEFTVTLKNAAGAALSESYPYKVYNSKDLEGTTSTDEINPQNEGVIKNSGKISLKADQVVVIEDIPAGTTYSVAESDSDDYSTTSIRDKNKPEVGDETGEKAFRNVVTGTLYWSVTEGDNGEEISDTTSTADFTNTYPSDFTLYKTDGSNGGVKLSGATFVLYQTDENDTKLYYSKPSDNLSDGGSVKTEWKALGDGEKEEDYGLTTNDKGTLTLDGLYDGDYTLKEIEAPSGYRLLKDEITLTVTDGKLTGRGTEGDSVTIGEDGLSLTVSNSAGYELPNTGGGGTWPYLVGGILLMAGSIIYMVCWRRKTLRVS